MREFNRNYPLVSVLYLIGGLVALSGCRSAGRLVDSLDKSEPSISDRAAPAIPGKRLVCVVWGQSNGESLAPNVTSETGHVYVKRWSNEGGRELDYVPAKGLSHSAAYVHMADLLAKRYRCDVYLINVCVGGTNSGQWAYGLKDRIAYYLRTEHVDFLIGIQGESDVWGHYSFEDSYSNYKIILGMIRSYTSAPSFLALDTLIPPEAPYSLSDNPVRRAQSQVIQDGLAAQGPDLDQLRFDPMNMDARGVHFQGPGLAAVGEAWARFLGKGSGI